MPTPRREKSEDDNIPVRWEYDKIVPYAARSKPLARPTPGIFDSPYVCLRINILWLPHIMGALDVLTAWDAWHGANDGLSARDEIEKLFDAMRNGGACLEFGETMILRQNPSNACQLQQSQDGGDTWTLAFDFSKCRPRNTAADDLQMFDRFQTVIQAYRDAWDVDPTVGGFTPELVYDTTARDFDRDLALCFAIGSLFDSIKEARVQLTDDAKPATQTIVGAIIALGIILAGVATGGLAWAAYAALAGVAASAMIEAGFALSASVTNDQYDDVRDDIICCMYSALKGSTLEQVDFQTSLSGCGFDVGSTQDLVAAEIIQVLQSEDMYLAMLKFMDESLGILDRGYDLPVCSCLESTTLTYVTNPTTGGLTYNTDGGVFGPGARWIATPFQMTVVLPQIERLSKVTVRAAFGGATGCSTTINGTPYTLVRGALIAGSTYDYDANIPGVLADTVQISLGEARVVSHIFIVTLE